MDFATAIGLGKSIGGLFKKKTSATKQYRDAMNYQNEVALSNPRHVVAGMEAAGLNPTLGFGGGPSTPPLPGLIGDSHATAGGIFSEGLDMLHDQALQETALVQENEKLRETIDELAKPSEPSHMDRYGGVMPLPSNGEMNGTQDTAELRVSGVRADGPQSSADRDLEVVTPYGTLISDPNWTPASQIEDEYGEPAAWVYSGVRAADFIADQIASSIIRRAEKTRNWRSDAKAQRGKAHTEKAKRRKASGWGDSPARSIAPTQREIDVHSFRRRALFGG